MPGFAMAWRPVFFNIRHTAKALNYSQTRHSTSSLPPAPEIHNPTEVSKEALSAGMNTTPSTQTSQGIHPDTLEQLFADPTWSVESLLPPQTRSPDTPQITSQQLHHLLRLSALPPPASPEQEQKMLETLAAQLHFVGKIQQVDTTGVMPLRAIRDETKAAEKEQTISLASLRPALSKETVVGTKYRRIQRISPEGLKSDDEDWDVLGSAQRKSGQYFVVENERPPE